MKEEWRDAPGYEGLYQVSNLGRVRTIRDGREYKAGYILKGKRNRYGYVEPALTNGGRRTLVLVHRLVAEAFIPNPLKLATVNHKNGVKTDNRVENLEWMSRRDNALHSLYVLNNISKAGKNVKGQTAGRKIRCIETGKVYPSIGAAARDTNHHQGNLSRALKNKWKAGGYHWEAVSE